MKSFFFITTVIALAKAGLWICFGLLVKNHLDSFWTFITRKSLPDGIIETDKLQKFYKITNWVGSLLIIIGAISAITALSMLVFSGKFPGQNFNFKF